MSSNALVVASSNARLFMTLRLSRSAALSMSKFVRRCGKTAAEMESRIRGGREAPVPFSSTNLPNSLEARRAAIIRVVAGEGAGLMVDTSRLIASSPSPTTAE